MPTSKKPGTRRVRKRRTSVSIGGVSQSAFAGYATTGGQQQPASDAQSSDVSLEQSQQGGKGGKSGKSGKSEKDKKNKKHKANK